MPSVKQTNLAMLTIVARRLGPLLNQVVFLGGCTTALFITEEGTADMRPTLDVDLIVEITSRMEYQQLEEQLRALGFSQQIDSEIICRWLVNEITVDIMPTNEAILGFSNRWYADAIKQANLYQLKDETTINLVTPPYFMATKIAAFQGRGGGDFLASHDMEDLITLVDGRPELLREIEQSPAVVKDFLAKEIRSFLENPDFMEALSGHLHPDPASQQRLPSLRAKLVEIACR